VNFCNNIIGVTGGDSLTNACFPNDLLGHTINSGILFATDYDKKVIKQQSGTFIVWYIDSSNVVQVVNL